MRRNKSGITTSAGDPTENVGSEINGVDLEVSGE